MPNASQTVQGRFKEVTISSDKQIKASLYIVHIYFRKLY